jgi:TolB-like protein/Tfp pilus assembly protein PilF
MAGSSQTVGSIRFGPYELSADGEELRKDGNRLKLTGQAIQVLVVLANNSGKLVTREELQQRLWPGATYGDFEHGLNAAVNRLRETLGDSATDPKYIDTIPRRGYRFIIALEPPTVAPAAAWVAKASLAVLPFVNATGDPETEYLSDGISESIINLLSQLPNLRVIPRTSAFRYKGRETDLKTVARDLKVCTVLTGRVVQRGDRLIVQTELVDVVNDAQLWGGQFNRKLEDIFEVQEELARQISENLQLRLTPEDEKRLSKRSTQNRDAYQLLLKAEYHMNKWTPEGLQRGMAYARQAIEADPTYAEAYAAVSAVYVGLGLFGFLPPAEAFPKAKGAALKALESDDTLAEAHTTLATVRLYYEWDWSGAEQACKRAIELNPNFAWAHSVWSDLLVIMGRHEEAMAEAQLGVELDPLSALLNVKLGHKLYWRCDYDRALEQLQKALELDPNFVFTHMILARVYAGKGMYERSLATCEKLVSLCGGSPSSRALPSLILAMAGKADEAKKILSELKKHLKLDPLSLICLAETHSVMGEKTEAFEFLEAAYQERNGVLPFLGVLPALDNIRSDPRFADLLRRLGLPHLRSSTSPS